MVLDRRLVPPAPRSNYREPTDTGQAAWVAKREEPTVAGRGSDLHLVLFLSSGGTLEEWQIADSPVAPAARTRFDGTARQAAAVLEWLAGRDRLTP